MTTEPLNLASEQRPLALRLRPDLRTFMLSLAGVEYRVLHDPATGKHFQLREEEFSILSQLNGCVSLSDLRTTFANRFAPQKIGLGRLQAFLAQAYRTGLLLSDYAEQGPALWARNREQRTRRMLSALAAIFQWRIFRFDPRSLLDMVSPLLLPLYSRVAGIGWFAGLAMACWIAMTHRHEMLEQLPQLSNWLRSEHFIPLALSLLIAKSWHELGHAVACRRWGVRCREMGVQLLFGVPCLYCDTTESWQLRDKWKRMGISAGGIYFEGFLAAGSAILYHFTVPGAVHDLCLNLLFVCTLGTLLVNANPLLRFDGYYLLADGLEIANLEARARSHAHAALEWLCFGGELRVLGPFESRLDLRFVCLGIVMLVYRMVLLGGMVWGVRMAFIPAKLAPVADLLTLLLAASVVLPMLLEQTRAREPFAAEERRRTWLRVLLPLLALFVLFACSVPLPSSLALPALLEPAKKEAIYATVPGRVVEMVLSGNRVKRGELLAKLENHEFTCEIARLQSAETEQLLLLQQAEAELLNNREGVGNRIPAARQSLASIRERRAELQRYVARLEVLAPQAGIVLPPTHRSARKSERELSTWSGSPLDAENRGAFMETGTLLCQLAEERTFSVTAIIDQADAIRVQQGHQATIRFSAISPQLKGEVMEVARVEAIDLPPELQSLKPPVRESQESLNYLVRIRIAGSPEHIISGMRCQVRIASEPETLLAKLRRWYERTIRVDVRGQGTRS